MPSYYLQYLEDHALDKVDEKFCKGLKEAIKKDVLRLLSRYKVKDEEKAEKIALLIYDKCFDKNENKPRMERILATLVYLPILLKYIIKNEMRLAEIYNAYFNLSFNVPKLCNELNKIIKG